MSRISLSKQIEMENEQHAFQFFKQALCKLPDPRRRQGKRYPLELVIVVALMATVCGADNAEAMEVWGKANRKWLSRFLPMPHGTPTQDVFLTVFAMLDPKSFDQVLRSWADLIRVRLKNAGKHIALDGKTSRHSYDTATEKPALHMVSAYLVDLRLVLCTTPTQEKSNEITAIPKLLATLDLHGITVTIDAMGTQKKIVKAILDGGGDYLLAVKENQPTLYTDVMTSFESIQHQTEVVCGEHPGCHVETVEETKKSHGRIERRKVTVCRDLSKLTTTKSWPGLAFIVQVERERTVVLTRKTSKETAYYIGTNRKASASQIAQLIRNHWSIENTQHYVLDTAFREDQARHRAGNSSANVGVLRRFALNMIMQDTTRKHGVAIARMRACMDRSYLLQLIAGPVSQTEFSCGDST